MNAAPSQLEVISALLRPETYGSEVRAVQHIETHISHLFLTGEWAYKLKKQVAFEFLDYSTLERRKEFCAREVLLNQRYAPEIYQDVVPVYYSEGRFRLGDAGFPCEYLVRMRQFDPQALFSELLARGALTRDLLRRCINSICSFHQSAQVADWRSAEPLGNAMTENFKVLSAPDSRLNRQCLEETRAAFDRRYQAVQPLFEQRKNTSIKLLHGDLHLKNICLWQGEPKLFDGIEFNDALACCDVWNDFAFLLMDLAYRSHPELATYGMNAYLERSDDFQGLPLLPLFLAYRSAVRAKVNCLEMQSITEGSLQQHAAESARRHLSLAHAYLHPPAPIVIAIGGLSGSGKTTLARCLAEQIRAVHIRSDVVRKQLLGITLEARADQSAYREEISERTYAGLLNRAETALQSGCHVILDAVHLETKHRDVVENWCERRQVPFYGVWCRVPLETALARVASRFQDASDANAAVVRAQYALDPGSLDWHSADTSKSPEIVADQLSQLFGLSRPSLGV